MFVVIEGQNSTCPCLDRPLLFITEGKVFLKILQISQEKTCVRVSFLTSWKSKNENFEIQNIKKYKNHVFLITWF